MKPYNSRLVVAVGAHPIVNGIGAVVSVLAGALASFFTGSIRASLALPDDPSKGTTFSTANWYFTGEAFIFWALVAAAALLFAWTKYSDSATANDHKKELNKKLHGLESMPPDAFLERLSKEYTNVYETLAQTRAQVSASGAALSKTNIDGSIKLVLDAIARISMAYDGNVADREYRISLFVFSRDAWDEDKLRLTVNLDHLARKAQFGTLEAIPSLCVIHSTEKKQILELKTVEAFSLPVHNSKSEDDSVNVIPGPAKAFYTNKLFECNSVARLVSEVEKTFPNKNQATALRNFYTRGLGKGVKSFVSMAVPGNKWAESGLSLAGTKAWGVVNIDSNHENLMHGAAGFFRPVVQPLLLTLSDLIGLRTVSERD